MKRLFILTVYFIAFTCECFAQDIIITKDARKIEVKMTEVNVDNIRYKRFDNPDGPIYTMPKSEIVSILYESGHVETFVTENVVTQTTSAQTPPTLRPGQRIDLYEMQRVEPALFQQHLSGRRQSGSGTAMIILGIVSATVGGIAAGVAEYEDDYYLGIAAVVAGGACLAAGIPIKIVGESKKRRAVNAYRMKYTANLPPHLQLNLNQNSLGLAFVF